MTIEERQMHILEYLQKEPDITVAKLARLLYVSEPTVRRDLTELDAKGVIRKVYGGAILAGPADRTIPFVLREQEGSAAKAEIGRRAAAQVSDGMVVLLDGSTSAYHLIPYLAKKKDLIVVAGGAKTAVAAAEAGICTYSTGGRLLENSYSYVGEQAIRFLKDINADIAFFSCRGLTHDGYATDPSVEEVEVRRTMLAQSRCSYLLCDSSKLGRRFFYNLCHTDALSGVITDTGEG